MQYFVLGIVEERRAGRPLPPKPFLIVEISYAHTVGIKHSV